MIRRLFMSLFSAAILVVSVSAQPPPKQPPTEPVQRTEADIEAIRQLESEAIRTTESMEPRAISHISFPATINVGITPWLNCSDWVLNNREVTEVITMDFREYVKNVLPNEWVNTWPAESIRAGAVAAKMFAWWRINLTEQYPGVFRPEGVHVVDNTCDQVFFRNSNRPTTNAAVDFTWPYRLHLNEYVQEIHYLAYDFQCAQSYASFGGGWSRCLPQWTTKDMADQGASWQVMINQFYTPISISVTGDIQGNANILKNPEFSLGTQHWYTAGGVQGAGVVDGVYNFYRGASGGAARLIQDIAVMVPQNAPLKLLVRLGNSGATPKQVTLRLLRSDGGAVAGTCTFTLPPNTPLQRFIMWGKTPAAWTGLRLEISGDTPDETPAYLMDTVNLRYIPDAPAEAPCQSPTPGKPKILTPASGLNYGHSLNVTLKPGKSNYVAGYNEAFHIQIDDSSGFGSPLFDNAASLATEPTLTTEVPGGTWYIRARQFDGVSLYSPWSPTVRFMTSQLPDQPMLISPVGDVPAAEQSFIWMATGQTESYRINVKDANKQKVFNLILTPAEANCSSICVVPLSAAPVALQPGQVYRWKAIARNAEGQMKSTKALFRLVVSP